MDFRICFRISSGVCVMSRVRVISGFTRCVGAEHIFCSMKVCFVSGGRRGEMRTKSQCCSLPSFLYSWMKNFRVVLFVGSRRSGPWGVWRWDDLFAGIFWINAVPMSLSFLKIPRRRIFSFRFWRNSAYWLVWRKVFSWGYAS